MSNKGKIIISTKVGKGPWRLWDAKDINNWSGISSWLNVISATYKDGVIIVSMNAIYLIILLNVALALFW